MIRFLFLLFIIPTVSFSTEILTFKWEKKNVFILNRKSLGKSPLQINGRDVKDHKITIYDRVAKEERSYQGFSLTDIFSAVYGRKWKESYKVRYAATDGYRVANEISHILESIKKGYRPFLVYKEVDQEGFSPFKKGRKKKNFAPFYVVWTEFKSGKVKDKVLKKLKWPYQLKEIDFRLMRPRRSF